MFPEVPLWPLPLLFTEPTLWPFIEPKARRTRVSPCSCGIAPRVPEERVQPGLPSAPPPVGALPCVNLGENSTSSANFPVLLLVLSVGFPPQPPLFFPLPLSQHCQAQGSRWGNGGEMRPGRPRIPLPCRPTSPALRGPALLPLFCPNKCPPLQRGSRGTGRGELGTTPLGQRQSPAVPRGPPAWLPAAPFLATSFLSSSLNAEDFRPFNTRFTVNTCHPHPPTLCLGPVSAPCHSYCH